MKNRGLSLIITSMLMLSLLCLTPIEAVNAQSSASVTTITAIVSGDVVPNLTLNNMIRYALNNDRDVNNNLILANNIADTEVLDANKMLGLTSLTAESISIDSIEGIQYATNLTYLHLAGNEITEIIDLTALDKLTNLHLGNNQITTITGLGNSTNRLDSLTYLNLNTNDITKIEGLDYLPTLTSLHLFDNEISKIEGLDNFPNLTTLNFGINNITKIEELNNLPKLTKLTLYHNQIVDLSPLNLSVDSTTIDYASNQSPTLPTALNNAGTVTITNPSKNYNGLPASISNISNGGTYNASANTITWTNVVTGGAPLTFDFSVPISSTNAGNFSGIVTVPFGPLAASVTLKYQNEAGTEIAPSTALPAALVGAAFTAPAPKAIPNYTFKTVKTGTGFSPATGTYKDTPQTIVYVYTKNSTFDIGNPDTGHALPIAVVLIVGTMLTAGAVVLKKNKA